MKDLTLATCSYNTPSVTLTMLKSFFKYHDQTPVIVCDNSTNEETSTILEKNKVCFIKNKNGLHAPSVDLLIDVCKTEYMLLVDTDIIFLKNHENIFNKCKQMELTLMGEVCGDRGGKCIYNRVHPWHCFINTNHIKTHGIKFFDYQRQIKKDGVKIYDVGSSFFEDICSKKLRIGNVSLQDIYYKHYEGMSWRINKFGKVDGDIDTNEHATHTNKAMFNYGMLIQQAYEKEINQYENFTIKAL